ncbi:PTS IIA-like nitrogen-regulatory protein PtsN [Rodentibacter rarus]|uniref:PTS IIA-like nitrogen-regulatory protein PtsN n=1 Tax=Rodentibacter rarus TaxID=1908260 RepID=A0A1V3IKY8_9PAST|nr:PTS IIA-like nitrogen regulatory protein PtsN [Rodentibacter rarus]OOF37443.1 PTS IIA-like nitrogen-regulatory protein PtsN [Rodentibacter rarus]OOF42401.1 PTS IIA-like nitrogen-regulatory protein PtsN [Rodentibacter rarus]
MKLTELFRPENIRQGVCFSSKKRLFESIAHFVVEQLHCDKGEQACFECLFNREKLGNSGLGNGVAMPKAKLPADATNKALAVFMQLETPIDYDAQDGKPVDLVFAVLVPEKQCQTYIPVLSALTEKLADKNFLKQLRSAKSAEEIWQIFEIVDQMPESTEALPEDNA